MAQKSPLWAPRQGQDCRNCVVKLGLNLKCSAVRSIRVQAPQQERAVVSQAGSPGVLAQEGQPRTHMVHLRAIGLKAALTHDSPKFHLGC